MKPLLAALIIFLGCAGCAKEVGFIIQKSAIERWTPDSACATNRVLEECLSWADDQGIDWRTRLRGIRVDLYYFATAADAIRNKHYNHAQHSLDGFLLNWLGSDDDGWPGRAMCHEMGHWFYATHQDMNNDHFPWKMPVDLPMKAIQ